VEQFLHPLAILLRLGVGSALGAHVCETVRAIIVHRTTVRACGSPNWEGCCSLRSRPSRDQAVSNLFFRQSGAVC